MKNIFATRKSIVKRENKIIINSPTRLGPAVRVVVYYHMMAQGGLLPLFIKEVGSWWERKISRVFHPVVLAMMKQAAEYKSGRIRSSQEMHQEGDEKG